MTRRKSEEGQALIETAVSMGLLVVLMLGAVEFGRLAFAAIEVSNAAKAAAQYGAQTRESANNQAQMQIVAQNEYFSPSGLTLISPSGTSGYTCNCADTGAITSCSNNSVSAPACPGSYMEVTLTVQTQAVFDPLIHIPGLPNRYTLYGNAKQKVLQ